MTGRPRCFEISVASLLFSAGPPVNTTGPLSEMRRIIPAALEAIESRSPRAMLSFGTPLERRLIASDSAKTVHMLEIARGSVSSGISEKS